MPRTPISTACVADTASLGAYGAEELRRVVRALLDTSRDPVLLVDGHERVVVDANAAAADQLGIPIADLRSRRIPLERCQGLALRLGATGSASVSLGAGHVHGTGRASGTPAEAMPSDDLADHVFRFDAACGALWVVALDNSRRSSQPPADTAAKPSGVDALTGLADRHVFQHRLAEALVQAAAPGGPACAVLFIDLDGFKPINDQLGHIAGDRLLCEVSRGIAGSVRPADLVARFGGDEFTVLVVGLTCRDDALGVAQRIVDQLSRFAQPTETASAVTASIGVAFSDDGYPTADAMLHAADQAMYAAKRLGKSRFAVTTPDVPSD